MPKTMTAKTPDPDMCSTNTAVSKVETIANGLCGGQQQNKQFQIPRPHSLKVDLNR